jgi:hypothetical protein
MEERLAEVKLVIEALWQLWQWLRGAAGAVGVMSLSRAILGKGKAWRPQ